MMTSCLQCAGGWEPSREGKCKGCGGAGKIPSNSVIGVDCSTKALAMCQLTGEVVAGLAYKPTPRATGGWQERLHFLGNEAKDYFRGKPTSLVYIEEAPMGRGFRASLEVGYVVGVCIVEAMRAGHLVVPVNVSTWKKQTVGNGRADKPQIKEWALRYVLTPEATASFSEGAKETLAKAPQDIYDAACIAAFARQNVR